MAIGDENNDIEMIEYAGLGVAMGSAPFAIKALADVTTTSNEGGVLLLSSAMFYKHRTRKENK
ncbi:MAG: HAD hydrolase family protein [Streptococcus sp.]